MLFAAVNVCRHLSADAEETLTSSSQRFMERFALVEQLAVAGGLDMAKTDFDTLNVLWAEAKKQLQNKNESERTEK